ncbi:hypothetical protein E2C01_051027 [Portunus trituberculatus]|uniref:Uncharacterized protein n=1 Tax=Portunus trituberculatus TaxID=210409 RepID=A0A5B7GHI6_PORTR|nr:hypothetical protein [Portunus trituberculatus]
MLELIREKITSGTPEMNYTVKKNKNLRKSSFDEIAATLQELFPSTQGVVGGTYPQALSFLLTLPVRQKSNHHFIIVTVGKHLGG